MEQFDKVQHVDTGKPGTVIAVVDGDRGCGRGGGCCETPDSVLVRFEDGTELWYFATEMEYAD